MQAFETSEYRARLDGVRGWMSTAGLDALLVLDESNICYLTGYEGFSNYVPQAALVTMDDDPYIILREQDLRCAEDTCWLPEDRLIGYAEEYVGSAERSAWEPIGEFVRGKVGASARIGAELSGAGLNVIDYPVLVGALGVDELRDGSGLVSKCRRIKSDQELAYMAESAAIASRAMLVGMDKIAVGVRQGEVAGTIMHALIAGTDTVPGGGMETTPWMHVGPSAWAPHLKWADEVYAAGQQTNLEFSAFRHRYAAPVARTAYLGSPPARLLEISKGVMEGWHAAFGAIAPGVRCSDVFRAFSAAIEPYGIRKESRIGYSIGIDWLETSASLAANDDTELVPNMTFHLLIGIWNRGEGYNFSESVRVTDSGAKSFYDLPRILFERPA